MGRNFNYPNQNSDAVPPAEPRSILLRAYADAEESEPPKPRNPSSLNSTLIFDTETHADETQSLRFGTYQVLKGTHVRKRGIFYGQIKPFELDILEAEAQKRRCELITVHEFVHDRFLDIAFKVGGLVVGFNLPFDLSRLAISHRDARVVRPPRSREAISNDAPFEKADRFMSGGFSFRLSPFDDQPKLRIKHQNSRSAFFSFAQPHHKSANESQRRKGQKPEFERGNFLDLKTLAAALTSSSHSLDSLAKFLGVAHKTEFKDFNRPIDSEMVEYGINDTEVTNSAI